MLTPDSIKSTKTQTGYKHVQRVGGPNQPSREGSPVYYQALATVKPGKRWVGPARKTARQAAQDYCDYVNANGATPAAPALKRAAHPKAKRKKITPAQQVALDILRDARSKPKAIGWVYLVIEENFIKHEWMRGLAVVKVGWTSKNPPEARLNDYQAGNPRKLVMIGKRRGTKRLESNIHKRHMDKNVLGEWFRLDDALLSEFNLKKEDIK